MSLRVAFFGTPEFARTVLQGILDSAHEVIAVVTAPDRPAGRGRKIKPGPASKLAQERGLKLLQPPTLRTKEARDELAELGADIFAVASYGLIFPSPALCIPKFGAINAHGSCLPLLRGAAPIERGILEGFAETGISIQQMVRRVDAGDVYATGTLAIKPEENAGDLRERLAVVAAELMPAVLTQIENGTAKAIPQDEECVTCAPRLESAERAIQWTESAEMVSRRVRAFAPKPGAYALLPPDLCAKRLKILACRIVDLDMGNAEPGEVLAASRADGLVVATGDGAVRLDTIQAEGKKAMEAAAFLSGQKLVVGQKFADGLICTD